MKIIDAKVIITCPGRNFVTLKLTTDEGITGVGDATLNGRELAVASYLTDHVCPLLLGRDASRIEDTWQFLYKGGYWRRGPVTMTAIAAVDTALWDIKGKVAGLPVYQLLGGRSRDGVTVGRIDGMGRPGMPGPRVAGSDMDGRDARISRDGKRQGVLTASRADDENGEVGHALTLFED